MKAGNLRPRLASRRIISCGGRQSGHSALREMTLVPLQVKPSLPTPTLYSMALPSGST